MAPLGDSEFCWAHDPEHEEEAAAARRAGGQVKKKQGTLALAYDLNGLETIPDIRRWIELAMFESLALDNTVNRNRVILSGTQTAARLLETGEQEERIRALEAAMLERKNQAESAFDTPEGDSGFSSDDGAA